MQWLAPMWNHCVVRASTPQEPFKDFETAQWAWARISELFPEMISAVLMPNHLHLILPKTNRPLHYFHKMSGLLSGISRRKKMQKLWQSMPDPTEIPDIFHLRRQVRYVALNPCRKTLCADPLEWYWSTYRELMGATLDGPDRAGELAQLFGEAKKNFRVRFHSYVSGDPSVAVAGTPLPISATQKIWAKESIGEILAAAAGALRVLPSDVQRRTPLRPLFIHLARRHGWRQPKLLAQICRMSPRAVHHILNQTPHVGLAAADLCLGDRRLRPADPFGGFHSE